MVAATDSGVWVIWDLMDLGPECVEGSERRSEWLPDKKENTGAGLRRTP